MKKRIYAGALVAFLTALTASACDGSADYYERGGGGPDRWCSQYTSCGTCTPVDGCGWCQTGVGQGMCAADPNDCSGASAFSWTWDPNGCFATADASVTPTPVATAPDSGAGADASDSGTGFTRLSDDGGDTTFDAGSIVH